MSDDALLRAPSSLAYFLAPPASSSWNRGIRFPMQLPNSSTQKRTIPRVPEKKKKRKQGIISMNNKQKKESFRPRSFELGMGQSIGMIMSK